MIGQTHTHTHMHTTLALVAAAGSFVSGELCGGTFWVAQWARANSFSGGSSPVRMYQLHSLGYT